MLACAPSIIRAAPVPCRYPQHALLPVRVGCNVHCLADQVLLINLRLQRGVKLHLQRRPRDIDRLVEIHRERDRPAAHQGQIDVVPILLGRVFDDGPALQERLLVVGQHEAIRGFPDWGRLDVAHANVPRPLAQEAQLDRLFVVRVARGQHGQGLAQFGIELLVGQLDAGDGVERHGAKALHGEEIEHGLFRRFMVAQLHLAAFDSDDDAAQLVGRFDHDALAAKLLQELSHRRVRRQIDGEALQGFGDRVFRGIGDGRDPAAVEILHHHAFQQVVDVAGLEFHLDLGVAGDLSGVFKESDAGTEQHHFRQRQI